LADFTKSDSESGWSELSDTTRQEGKSKAALVIQKTKVFRRAILFTLLNPQPNGAGFAGVTKTGDLDLSSFETIQMKIRTQGAYNGFKFILRNNNESEDEYPSYCYFIEGPVGDFEVVSMPLSDFKPYRRGRRLDDKFILDKAHITSIGIQTYGGIYQPKKQSGVAALEIEWIKVI